mgnify:CR=1 FL=1
MNVDDLFDLVRRAAPYSALPRSAFDATLAVLDHLKIDKAHFVGLSMGSYSSLQIGLNAPERALSMPTTVMAGPVFWAADDTAGATGFFTNPARVADCW